MVQSLCRTCFRIVGSGTKYISPSIFGKNPSTISAIASPIALTP